MVIQRYPTVHTQTVGEAHKLNTKYTTNDVNFNKCFIKSSTTARNCVINLQ